MSVDNIFRRIHDDCLLDEKLNVYHAQMDKVGKEDHDYRTLIEYSVTSSSPLRPKAFPSRTTGSNETLLA